MRAQDPVVIILIIAASTLLTACQKKPAEQTLHAAEMTHSNVSAKGPLNKKDLGVLPLSNHISTTISLGKNRQCTITPTLLRSGNLRIILSIETTGTDGKAQNENVACVRARVGEPFNISIGDMNLSFTPQLTAH